MQQGNTEGMGSLVKTRASFSTFLQNLDGLEKTTAEYLIGGRANPVTLTQEQYVEGKTSLDVTLETVNLIEKISSDIKNLLKH